MAGAPVAMATPVPAAPSVLDRKLSNGVGVDFNRSSVVASSLSYASVEREDGFESIPVGESEDPLSELCPIELFLIGPLVTFWVLTMTKILLLLSLASN
ncbi:MAG: hypothetical protein P8101_13255 [Candidatus Thiodiazotropha sp.]